MSYGHNFHALFRRAAEYVDKILRGHQCPDKLLALADEVIE